MMRRAGTSEHEGGFKGVSFREMDQDRDTLIVVQFKARKIDNGGIDLHVEETRGGTGTKRTRTKNIRFTYSAEAWAELVKLVNEVQA